MDVFKLSTDPEFESKLVDVVGLYLNPPSRAVVFSFDEKTQCQALDRTQPSLPLKPGRAGTMTHDYQRHGTIDLFAAMNVGTGQVHTQSSVTVKAAATINGVYQQLPDYFSDTPLGRLLRDEHSNHPQAVLERSRRPGRSMGTLARALEDFFVQRGLALPTDQSERLAAGRRQRRVGAVPEPLRPAVQQFAEHMLTSRRRARTAGTRPRTDHTIEQTLAAVRDLARYLVIERGKLDWSVVDRHDVESFVAAVGSGRISLQRNFFRFTRHRRIVLIDPTRGMTRNSSRSFIGKTLSMDRQRLLFHRWTTDPTIHPHEALLGVLALLHAASNVEVRMLQVRDIDMTGHSIRMGRRRHPVPLDPASWAAVQRTLTHRQDLRTGNPHLEVTRGTKAGREPASSAYVTHLLDPAGICPRTVRCTRLAALINSTDPKLVAAALGMNTQGTRFYLADHVDDGRLPARNHEPVTLDDSSA